MALRLDAKQAIVAEVSTLAQDAVLIIAADYRGLTVTEMTDLRRKARDAGMVTRVVRNTLARRALEGTDYACLLEALVGPIVLMFTQEDPGVAARVVKDFAKGNEKLEVKALAMGDKFMTSDQLQVVASLPTRDEALGQLCGVLMAPMTKLVRTLAEPHSQLVRVLAAYGDKKQAA